MAETLADTKAITTAVDLARHAPSLHNSQPWRWITDGITVDLIPRSTTNLEFGRQVRSRSDH